MIDLRYGDCLELVKDIPDKSVDLLLTDPPYLHIKGGCKSKVFNKGVRDSESKVVSDMSDFGEIEINEFLDTVKPKMKVFNAYIFCSKRQIPYYLNWALRNKYQFQLFCILTYILVIHLHHTLFYCQKHQEHMFYH